MLTPEDTEAVLRSYEELERYIKLPNEELIKIFLDESADIDVKNKCLEALIEKSAPELADLILTQIKDTQDDEWRLALVVASFRVPFRDKSPILREAIFDVLQNATNEVHICTCLLRYCYLVALSNPSLLDKVLPWVKTDDQKMHFYQALRYCRFCNLSVELLDLISKECQEFINSLPPRGEAVNSHARVRFMHVMKVLFLNKKEEYDDNCKLLLEKNYKYLVNCLNNSRF